MIFLISLIHNLLFNSSILYENYRIYQITGSSAFYDLALSFIESLIANFAFFYVFSFNKKIFSKILYITFFSSALSSYFVFNYHININEEILATIFESNHNERLSFVEINLFLWLSFSIICAYFLQKIAFKKPDNKIIFISASFVLFALFADSNLIKTYIPYNYISSTYKFLSGKIKTSPSRTDISLNEFSIHNKTDDLIVVLVIGESARSDHFSLNGYERDTNPHLKKINNLVTFKDAISCGVLTRTSVPCMITRATETNFDLSKKETSFIKVFSKLNFNTYWISNQATRSVIDEPINIFYKEASQMVYLDNINSVSFSKKIDEDMIPFFDKAMNENPDNKKLILLHTYGSHFHYELHYPKEFQQFKPICSMASLSLSMKHCSKKEIINSYDNSILYTDYFLKKIIDKLKDKNALFIYTSDHGESLGEDGYYLHGNITRKEQKKVPIIFWMSDQYIQNFPKNYNALKENSSKHINHDFIFHSILGCSTIKSAIIDNSLNLCVLNIVK